MTATTERYRTPAPWERAREIWALRELVRLPAQSPRLLRAPRGDGRTTLLFPGIAADDGALSPLRGFLRSRGHDARGWSLGRNSGDIDRLLDKTAALVTRTAERTERPVNLVGWSLGGVYAREASRELPGYVHRVATLGTPIQGPRYTTASVFYPAAEIERIERLIAEARNRPITVPVLSIYSRFDGIIDWRTAVDDETPGVANVQVSSSHFGMSIDPSVWSTLARFLAAG